jgi:hypothetical protein
MKFCALRAASLPAILSLLCIPGCSIPYYNYEITDPSTGSKYYTRDMLPNEPHKPHYDTEITFRDARTKKTVTLPKADVRELSNEAWKEATSSPTPK